LLPLKYFVLFVKTTNDERHFLGSLYIIISCYGFNHQLNHLYNYLFIVVIKIISWQGLGYKPVTAATSEGI